jgi:hypothetical protein
LSTVREVWNLSSLPLEIAPDTQMCPKCAQSVPAANQLQLTPAKMEGFAGGSRAGQGLQL